MPDLVILGDTDLLVMNFGSPENWSYLILAISINNTKSKKMNKHLLILLESNTMNRGRDACISLRKTYNGFLKLLTTWTWLAYIVSGLPVLYIMTFMVYNSVNVSYIGSLLSTSGYSVFGVLLVAWIVAVISIWKNLPNLLTLTIFIYTCLGHWSLVSLIVLIFYGFSNLPGSYIAYLCTALLPSILLLILSGDLMRKKRSLMFEALNSQSRPLEETPLPPALPPALPQETV